MRWVVVALLASTLLAGCSEYSDRDRAADGHFVRYFWGNSIENCSNGNCKYGTNEETESKFLPCSVEPTLSWDVKNWKHGTLSVRVLDDQGAQAASQTITGDGEGFTAARGAPWGWTLEVATYNANGQADIRLTCG